MTTLFLHFFCLSKDINNLQNVLEAIANYKRRLHKIQHFKLDGTTRGK